MRPSAVAWKATVPAINCTRARLLELTENLPVRIDIVDLPERIGPLLVALEGIICEGLVTIA